MPPQGESALGPIYNEIIEVVKNQATEVDYNSLTLKAKDQVLIECDSNWLNFREECSKPLLLMYLDSLMLDLHEVDEWLEEYLDKVDQGSNSDCLGVLKAKKV